MRNLVDNRPYKVHCPVCGKFMESGIPRGSHCIEFRHHCVEPGSFVKLSFYAEYRLGRYGKTKSVHWRPAKNFKIVQYRKPKPIPVPVGVVGPSPTFTPAIEEAVRGVFLREVYGVNQVMPTVTSLSVNHSPYGPLTFDMNIVVTVVS